MPTTIDVEFNSLPYIKDYFVRQGDTINHPWALTINDTVKDLTSCTLTLTVESAANTSVIAARAVAVTGANNSQFSTIITAADTAAMSGLYRYEVKCVFPADDPTITGGGTRVLLAGTITVEDVV